MTHRFKVSWLALAAAAAPCWAQEVQQVVITGRASPAVTGFGSLPLAQTPVQASVFGTAELLDGGQTSLAGLTRLDAGISDAYNTEGYWSYLTVRGYVLDNRSNFRRDGLPINAETALSLANKDRVEVLKGTSGAQAGISAPGGLVNLVVKRPNGSTHDLRVALQPGGGAAASVDLGGRFGDGERFGLRLNAALAALQPPVHSAAGQNRLLALACDWQITQDSRLEAELETSRQSQPSRPGFSLRGNGLPDADGVDPRINLNNQPWSQPVVLDGTTASLRWRQRVSADWQFTAHGMTQQLRSDDRVAFPFGCYDASTKIYWADRYCPDGSFDLYDYRSDNERRRADALDLQFTGAVRTGSLTHDLTLGMLTSRLKDRFQLQAFNASGSGQDDGSAVTPAAPDATSSTTDRDDRSTEWYLRDMVQVGPAWSLWAGLRHARLQRSGKPPINGDPGTRYDQSFTTPWLALAHRWTEATLAYVSVGEGVETDVAPNRSRYSNAGQPLPALKSRQVEAGLKHDSPDLDWSLTGFRIQRPQAVDIGSCDIDASCLRRIDGHEQHQGLEAALGWRRGAWSVQGGAMWLDARRSGASDPAVNGLQPTNVPRQTLKVRLSHDVLARPGLQWQAALMHEGQRMVTPDNSIEAPAWTRVDVGARWVVRTDATTLVWRAGIDNLLDTRAWRETPYQFGHAYLFPLDARTWRVSMLTRF